MLVTGSALRSDSIGCSRGKIGIFKCFESFSISTGRTSSQSTSRSSSRVKLVTPYIFSTIIPANLYESDCMTHTLLRSLSRTSEKSSFVSNSTRYNITKPFHIRITVDCKSMRRNFSFCINSHCAYLIIPNPDA